MYTDRLRSSGNVASYVVGDEQNRGYLFSKHATEALVALGVVDWLPKGVVPRGLFAQREIAINTKITPFAGTVKFVDNQMAKSDDSAYYRGVGGLWANGQRQVVDGYRQPIEGFGLAQFANHARDTADVSAKIVTSDGQGRVSVWLQATRNIPRGAEILIDYGKAYWSRVHRDQGKNDTTTDETEKE
jgi:hypothetical protein